MTKCSSSERLSSTSNDDELMVNLLHCYMKFTNKMHSLHAQFEELCFIYRDYCSEVGFVCPLEQSRRLGRNMMGQNA